VTERNQAEADRLIDAALADHRVAAPKRLRERLERRFVRRRRPPVAAFAGVAALAAALAAALVLVLRPAAPTGDVVAREAVGDHLRILIAPHLDVEASDMHQVKPWFAGKLEFVPPVTFLGDDDFPLRGGALVVFDGHKAAAFVYHRRLHVISLFVYPSPETTGRTETTRAGFHVIAWRVGDVGMTLVSDVGWDDLRALEARLR
jgi:anti-sigma factor RsiW